MLAEPGKPFAHLDLVDIRFSYESAQIIGLRLKLDV
jgi:hypothetical protein